MQPPAWAFAFLDLTFWVCLVYAALLLLFVLAMMLLATAESALRDRQRAVEDFDSLQLSRFTIPVSILAPALNEEAVILPAVKSLLRQDYPEFEVILIDDGSTDGTLALLDQEFDLEAREVFYKRSLPTTPIRAIYKSRVDPRLTVVSKDSEGNKADPLNCGVNLARYRYLCCVDGDTVYSPDALLQAMAKVVKDPATIVGAGSLFGISAEPESEHRTPDGFKRMDRSLLARFQHLDLLRSFVAYRLAWSRLDCMLCNPGAFSIWRRDVVIEVGGFSPAFTCEDIEITFRIHEKFLREKRPYKVISLPFMVASTEGPDTVRNLVSQRARWQRVILETVWAYRHMLGRPRFGSVGLIGFPYYVLFEALAPLFQALSLVAIGVAIGFHLLNWPIYLSLLGVMVFSTAVPNTVALHLHDVSYRDVRLKDLALMLLLGPLDLFLYRPILMWAGLKGLVDFLRGDKGYHKFERNRRKPAEKLA